MIKNKHILEQFEKQYQQSNLVDYHQNLKIVESLWEEAIHLGIVPLSNPLDGIESDIELAKVLNSSLLITSNLFFLDNLYSINI